MQKEEVLKLKYLKINDDYTIATITYQNDKILKRNCFNDNELRIKSIGVPCFISSTLYIRGYIYTSDNMPVIVPNDYVEFVKEKVKKLNEKYGIPKKWCPDLDEKYYLINLKTVNNIVSGFWDNTKLENEFLKKNLIFKTEEEAEFVANKILENIDSYREEYQKQKKGVNNE